MTELSDGNSFPPTPLSVVTTLPNRQAARLSWIGAVSLLLIIAAASLHIPRDSVLILRALRRSGGLVVSQLARSSR